MNVSAEERIVRISNWMIIVLQAANETMQMRSIRNLKPLSCQITLVSLFSSSIESKKLCISIIMVRFSSIALLSCPKIMKIFCKRNCYQNLFFSDYFNMKFQHLLSVYADRCSFLHTQWVCKLLGWEYWKKGCCVIVFFEFHAHLNRTDQWKWL